MFAIGGKAAIALTCSHVRLLDMDKCTANVRVLVVKRTYHFALQMSASDPKRTVHAIFTAVPFLKRAA